MPATPRARSGQLTEEELGSAAQRDRRKRIIEATIALASKGGFDAVQMRAVAERADVALGTLYRYFPSKIHLLVSGLATQLEHSLERAERGPIPGDNAAERVLSVLGRITKGMQREPHLTEAMTRAFMFADTSAATEVDQVALLIETLFIRAMGHTEPTEEDKAIARVIGDVWLSNLVAWVTRRASASDVTNRLELTVRLLLR
ncbi:cholesterol catabolism transcriptional regulator KstR [Kutzneria viridogrisea]|uniref:HTH-type transcription repressor KstR n=2 Tax=Kutzneria TaxID=43356 RepID=W5W6U7_9PSEU|nr:cholesterol catabolism transcriptional regulator KstR [Kutzneria albida]AHH96485.1 HTH-type transcription repressor KstR [Kutzneria albida DSM 43870]MBA8928297.1 AcrR family transcriptional regulator [Kutzneria viridogrisea]